MNSKYWIMRQDGSSSSGLMWELADVIEVTAGKRSDATFREWLRENGEEGELYRLMAPISSVIAIAERIVKDIKVQDEANK